MNKTVIIGSQFCDSSPTYLSIVRKTKFFGSNGYDIVDGDDNIVFKVKELQPNDNLILFDASGTQILTMKSKSMSWHGRWQALGFRGETSSDSDLIFSVRNLSIFSWKEKLSVFLANNGEEKISDFIIRGNWSKKSCLIVAGDSSSIVAEIHRKGSPYSAFAGKKGKFITVHSGVDSAFVVSLAIILAAKHEAAMAAAAAASASAASASAAASAAAC